MSNSVTEYDYVVIGSSPILVLEAIYQQRLGKKVAVLDDRERIGGAWYVKELFGHTNVEVGCHFISNMSRAYHFLDKTWPFRCRPWSRSPFTSCAT